MTTTGVDDPAAEAGQGPTEAGSAATEAGQGATVLLTQLARVVYRRVPEPVLGMRLKEFGVLHYLRDHGPAAQQALGETMCVDPNTLVLLLNDLESAGWAVRRRDPADRRRHIVDLTPDGVAALRRADRGLESIEDDVLGALGPDDRATLRTLLARALDGIPGGQS